MLENGAIKKFLENFNFSEYDKKCNNCSNVFYLMNLREDTHSKLLTWLFDFNNKKEDSIQYKFSREFFKNFLPNINMENGTNINIKSQKIVEEGRPDIVLEIGNNLIVIEVKLDARTSIIEYENKRRTQYERYQIWAKNYPKFKKYLLIYTTDERLKTEKDFYIGEEHIDEMNGNDIVNRLDYVSIQFSDIVLILYKILKNDYGYKQINENQNIIALGFIDKFIGYVKNKNNRNKIKELRNCLKNNSGINKQIIKKKKLKRPIKCNIPLDEIIKEMSQDEIIQLLIQYIDYWQYNDKIIGSYTEIVEIENNFYYLWDIKKLQ